MSKQERLMVKGLIAEKKQRLSELDVEMKGLALVIRSALPTYLGVESYNVVLVSESAQRLCRDKEEYSRLQADLHELQAEWGNL